MLYSFIILAHLSTDERTAVRRAYRFLRTSGDAADPTPFTIMAARRRIARIAA
jgi:hypothetical protein